MFKNYLFLRQVLKILFLEYKVNVTWSMEWSLPLLTSKMLFDTFKSCNSIPEPCQTWIICKNAIHFKTISIHLKVVN